MPTRIIYIVCSAMTDFPYTIIIDISRISVYEYFMKIVWDEPKREANIAKHGLDFAALTAEFFENAFVEDAKQGRYVAIGEFKGIMIIAVVFRPLGVEALSIISMRRASKIERSRL